MNIFEKMSKACKYNNNDRCIYFGITDYVGSFKAGTCNMQLCPLFNFIVYKQQLYKKVSIDEEIKPNAVMEFNGQNIVLPIAHPEDTVGKMPSDFSKNRTFYNPVII